MAGRRSRRTSSPAVELPSDAEDIVPDDPENEQSEDEEDESDFEPVEPNLATRVKRANAGNRMRALLEDEQGAEAEEMFKEEVDDVEFKQKEEADVFDSDFGSTDEDEYGDDDEDAGERRLENEAKAEKKAAKAKKKKGFVAPSHPFARTTKDQAKKAARAAAQPVASTSADTLDEDGVPLPKRKKGPVDPNLLVPMRESSRRSAVEFKQEVKERLVESEKRRAVAPKPQKKKTRTLTQADLIAEALETEEVNRAALLAFYAAEEDRREAERVAGMRYEIIGPKLTFLSRTEGGIEKRDKGKGKAESGRRRMIEVLGESGQKGWKGSTSEPNADDALERSQSGSAPNATDGQENAVTTSKQRDLKDPLPWTRNWLIFDQFEGTRADEYEALFGDHVDWSQPAPPRDGKYFQHDSCEDAALTYHALSDLKLKRCALTGMSARYRDPRTLAPFASLEAYHVLNSIVDAQAFIWSDSLGAYTGTSGFGLAREVEATWAQRPAARARIATASDAPPVLLPLSAPPPRSHSTRQSLGSSRPRPIATKEDNPYVREYASSAGSRRAARGSDVAMAQSGLPPLPSSAGFPPLPAARPAGYPAATAATPTGFPPLPGRPNLNHGVSPHSSPMHSPHTAPQARSININGGSGFFGSPSPFGPAPTQRSGPPLSSPFPPVTPTMPIQAAPPSLPPLPPQ
ncbi:uncharacterized protein JCM15063_002298 [Sporobolomyces koalae]|uniref:uncharacterized protein n=1 Tax=Sporobolomyces koalae TaxID=500713 RepID=UPI00317D3DCC